MTEETQEWVDQVKKLGMPVMTNERVLRELRVILESAPDAPTLRIPLLITPLTVSGRRKPKPWDRWMRRLLGPSALASIVLGIALALGAPILGLSGGQLALAGLFFVVLMLVSLRSFDFR